LQGLITAGREAGINLETISTAFAAAGGAVETTLEATPDITPLIRAHMRLGYISAIINLRNFREMQSLLTSLGIVGITPPRYEQIFNIIDLVLNNTISNQRAREGGLLTASYITDIQELRIQEFSALASQDVLLMKIGMEFYNATVVSSEYGDKMLELTGRMAAMGGVMTGMTPEMLLGILGRPITISPLLKTLQTALVTAPVPTLLPFELAAWSYINREPGFRYSPIQGLADPLATPITSPTLDRLAEPYRSMALLMSDLGVVGNLRGQDQKAADDYSAAHPLDPPGWYPLATVHQILESDRQRLALVRQHISGVSPEARDALICLINSRMTEF
jgi:hypothetical protein